MGRDLGYYVGDSSMVKIWIETNKNHNYSAEEIETFFCEESKSILHYPSPTIQVSRWFPIYWDGFLLSLKEIKEKISSEKTTQYEYELLSIILLDAENKQFIKKREEEQQYFFIIFYC
jgi:hypothetical protein